MAKEPVGSGEIHRADPGYRRQMLVWLVVAILAGGIGLYALVRWLDELRNSTGQDPRELGIWLQRLMAGLCLLLAAGCAGLAHWLHQVAVRTFAEKRWPPKDLQTTSDMPVRYLSAADGVARQVRAGSMAFAVLAALIAGWGAWLMML